MGLIGWENAMPSGKEIRNKIKSVENTRKITKAMEMVAASKMRKAQDRMRAARPYGDKIRRVAANLSHAIAEYKHPFLTKRESVKNVGLILRHFRQGSVRRSELERAASRRAAHEGMGNQRGQPAGHCNRQQGFRLHAACRCQGRIARHRTR